MLALLVALHIVWKPIPCPPARKRETAQYAKATTGGRLPARYVIHAVGPVWHGGGGGEPGLLASVHRRVVELADDLGCASVALPAISCGIYAYPAELAAPVALGAVASALEDHPNLTLVRFVFLDEGLRSVFADAAETLGLSA